MLLALVDHGRPRQAAYVMVQRCSMKALAGEGRFRDLCTADAEIAAALTPGEIDRCFDLERALAHAGTIVDRAMAAP